MIGTVYTSPWGDYEVTKLVPFTLQAVAHPTAFIVNPCASFVVKTEAPPAPEPVFEGYQKTLGAFRSLMSMACLPGDDFMVWVPCAGRSRIPEHAMKTHVYFMASVSGSIYCPECRALQPRRLYMRDGVVIHDSHHDVVSASSYALARGSGGESSSPDLVAMTVAREEVAPPVPSDAKAVLSPELAPSTSPPPSPTPVGRAWLGLWEWKEWCAERAAITEFDGNQIRAIAERAARELAGPPPKEMAA